MQARCLRSQKRATKKAWVEPVVDRKHKSVRFEVETGNGSPRDGTKQRGKSRYLHRDLLTPRQLIALNSVIPGSAGFQPANDANAAKMAALPEGWHSRGYLPHFEGGAIPQMITFHLADSLPAAVLARFENELATLPETKAQPERRKRIEAYLDSGAGSCWLARPEVAGVVESALLHFDSQRYRLHAWVIMPNHVHVLITPLEGRALAEIVHSWKSYTANEANKLLGVSGQFWQREYYDRFIRDEKHYRAAVEYIEMNPVKAGLCARPEDWPAGSARFGSARRGSASLDKA